MNRLVVIGNTDITPYIDWQSYKMDRKPAYESWKDGNYIEHRIYVRTRLEGSFRVWLAGINGMDTEAFINLIESATANHVTTMGVYDPVSGSTTVKAIEAYVDITPGKHREMMNGDYFDILTVKVSEK